MKADNKAQQTQDTDQRGQTSPVPCAFCGGTGRDPFGVMSPLSVCQVCGGTGHHTLRQPIAACPFCGGAGIHPGTRLTCVACGGIGSVEIPVAAVPCSCCHGSGRAKDHIWPDSPFPCSCCGGKGVVVSKQQKEQKNEPDSG